MQPPDDEGTWSNRSWALQTVLAAVSVAASYVITTWFGVNRFVRIWMHRSDDFYYYQVCMLLSMWVINSVYQCAARRFGLARQVAFGALSGSLSGVIGVVAVPFLNGIGVKGFSHIGAADVAWELALGGAMTLSWVVGGIAGLIADTIRRRSLPRALFILFACIAVGLVRLAVAWLRPGH